LIETLLFRSDSAEIASRMPRGLHVISSEHSANP
jgi:hypothetical protein